MDTKEKRKIFEEMQDMYRKEDIESEISQLDTLGIKLLKAEDNEEILDRFESILSKNDPYWDAYWHCIDSAINEHVDTLVKDFIKDREEITDVVMFPHDPSIFKYRDELYAIDTDDELYKVEEIINIPNRDSTGNAEGYKTMALTKWSEDGIKPDFVGYTENGGNLVGWKIV